jgi:hypothetical protein
MVKKIISRLDAIYSKTYLYSTTLFIFLTAIVYYFFFTTPAGVSKTEYKEYKSLQEPKILYSCDLKNTLHELTSIFEVIEKCKSQYPAEVRDACIKETDRLGEETPDNKWSLGQCPEIMKDFEREMQCNLDATKKISDKEVGYLSGKNNGDTYNQLLLIAKNKCDGEFKVIESSK